MSIPNGEIVAYTINKNFIRVSFEMPDKSIRMYNFPHTKYGEQSLRRRLDMIVTRKAGKKFSSKMTNTEIMDILIMLKQKGLL